MGVLGGRRCQGPIVGYLVIFVFSYNHMGSGLDILSKHYQI